MTNSTSSNLKRSFKNIFKASSSLLATTTQVVADTTDLTVDLVENVVPVTKDVIGATRDFGIGVCNPNASDKELADKAENLNVSDILKGMREKSAKAGRSISKSTVDFINEE